MEATRSPRYSLLEIVFTQLIKTRGLALGTRRDDVPNLHVAVVDEDAIDQELHQGSLLRKGGLSSSALDTLTKRLDGRHHACQLSLPIDLCLPLRFLGCQGVLFLCTTWKVSCNLLNLRKQFAEEFFRDIFVSH